MYRVRGPASDGLARFLHRHYRVRVMYRIPALPELFS